MVKLFSVLCLLLCSLVCWSRDSSLVSVPKLLDFSDRDLTIEQNSQVSFSIIPDSIEWFRKDQHLLLPYGFVEFVIDKNINDNSYFVYKGETHHFKKNSENQYVGLIHYSFYESDSIYVYSDSKFIKEFKVMPKKGRQVIDSRCRNFNLKISDKTIPISLSCHNYPYGSFGKEKNQIDIYLASPYMNKDANHKITFIKSNKALISLTNKNISIEVTIPKRFNRLKTAIGFGPYSFKAEKTTPQNSKIAGAIMLYGAYTFSDDVSLKFFDAFIGNDASFNNGGLYLANNIAKLFDSKIIVNTLLGAQILSFNETKGAPIFTESIYPQGIEATWYDAFGYEKFLFSGGIFVNLTNDFDYQNAWVRFGKGYYYELNYINWKKDDRLASMWGLSVIFPFLSFF